MSTIAEICRRVEKLFPGTRFDTEEMTRWIYEVDTKALDQLIGSRTGCPAGRMDFWYWDGQEWKKGEGDPCQNEYITVDDPLNNGEKRYTVKKKLVLRPYSYATDADKQVLIPYRFDDVYINYIGAKMAAADNEIAEYNNQVLLYQAAWEEYASWYIRNFPQESSHFEF